MQSTITAPTARDRAILQSFAHRIDATDPGALNNLGVLYFTKGMIEDAVAAFTRALELDVRMTIAQRNLEIAYFTSGYYDTRVQELHERLEASATDRAARWELGRTHLLLGDVPRALDEFSVLLRDDPDDVAVIRQVATAEARGGNLESAWHWLRHALEVQPDNPAVLFQLGEVAYHRGLNEEARVCLSRAVELAPDDADATYLLGFVLGDQGDHEGAMAAAARAQRLNPSLGVARANLSLERFDRGSHHAAREVREARGIVDASPGAGSQRLTHHNLGLAFRHKGYLDEAIREYRLALDRGEDAHLVSQAMAEVHLLRGDMPAALALYDRLVTERPHDPKVWNERGVALHHGGEYAAALDCYERALASDPQYAVAWNNLGVAAHHAGEGDRALDGFTRALQLNAGFLKARLNLAYFLVRRGDVDHALTAYRQVLRLDAEHPVAWNGVGLVLSGMKRFDEARNAFGRAIEARASYAEAHYNLGFALTNLGDHAGALRETQRGLELDAFYAPQKFELAIAVEYEDPRLDIAPDLGGERRDATVDSFQFEESTLETLFDDLAPGAPAGAVAAAPADAFSTAYAYLAAGAVDDAAAEIRRAIADGAPRVAGFVALGDVFLARGAAGEALERYREARLADAAHGKAAEGEVRALVALRRFAEAAAPAEWLASHRADDPDIQLLVARVRMDTDRLDGARHALQLARRLAPERADVRHADARLARREGDTSRAITAMREALAIEPDHAERQIELGELVLAVGEVIEAEFLFASAAHLDPRNDAAVLALARLRRDLGRADETVTQLAAFLTGDPYHIEALATLGEALFLVGRREDARFAFARVRRFEPDQVAALYFEGVILAEAHEYAAAIARWDRVIERDPSGEYAQRARRDTQTALAIRERLVGPLRHGEAA